MTGIAPRFRLVPLGLHRLLEGLYRYATTESGPTRVCHSVLLFLSRSRAARSGPPRSDSRFSTCYRCRISTAPLSSPPCSRRLVSLAEMRINGRRLCWDLLRGPRWDGLSHGGTWASSFGPAQGGGLPQSARWFCWRPDLSKCRRCFICNSSPFTTSKMSRGSIGGRDQACKFFKLRETSTAPHLRPTLPRSTALLVDSRHPRIRERKETRTLVTRKLAAPTRVDTNRNNKRC